MNILTGSTVGEMRGVIVDYRARVSEVLMGDLWCSRREGTGRMDGGLGYAQKSGSALRTCVAEALYRWLFCCDVKRSRYFPHCFDG